MAVPLRSMPLPQQADQSPDLPTLKRILGLPTGLLLVAGSMIGSGVFKKIVPMSQVLGNEKVILLAWLLAGIVTMLGAFTYAGLSSLSTGPGGVYEYLRQAWGEFIAFLFGWTTFTIIGSGSIAAVAFVFAQSFAKLVPLSVQGIYALAIGMIFLLTWLNFRGVQNSGRFSNMLTAAKVTGIFMLIILGLCYPSPMPAASGHAAGETKVIGVSALLTAMLSAFWAYDGWANITYITGEIKNPKRNIPLAITGGVGFTIVLYLLLNAIYMRVIPLRELAAMGRGRIAGSEVSQVLLGHAGTVIFSLLIMMSTLGALHANILSYPRIYFKMAQEQVFFKKAARLHPVFQTPGVSLFLSAGWSSLLLLSRTFDQLTDLVIFAVFIFFGLGALALIKMKRAGKITVKVTGYPFVPWVILLFCLGLLGNTLVNQTRATLTGLALIASGIPFYFYFKRSR